MKKRFTLVTAVFALLAILVLPTGMKGQTRDVETFTFSELSINDATEVTTIVGDNVTLTFAQGNGSNPPKYYSNGSAVRMYPNNTLEVALNNQTSNIRITTIDFTFYGTYSGSLQNWTGSETSVSFTNTASGQARIQVITVTFSEGGVAPTTYSVNLTQTDGGTISAEPTQATAGTTITLTATADEGYSFGSWNIEPSTITIADNQFTMPASNVTVSAQWIENTTPTPTDIVTYDFSTTNNFLTSYPNGSHPGTGNSNNLGTFYYTNGDAFTASGTNRYFNNDGYFLLGKTGATLQLPTFDFDVEKIVITGKSGASGSVVQNIYVGDQAVSTATTGATGENTYYIASGNQSARTYTLKVTSNHNTQITKIEVYRKSDSSVSIPSFSPAAGTYVEAQTVSIDCETEGASIVYKYTENGEWQPYSQALTISETTTIWAKATKSGMEDSEMVSATYTIVSIEHEGTEADPYTVADARNSIEANVGINGVYATGIVSEIVTAYDSEHGNVTFDIVDEAGSTTTLRAYRCTGDYADDVAVNDVVVIYGNLTKYNNTYEFAQGCEIISLTPPSYPIIKVAQESITLAHDATSGAIAYSIQNVDNAVANAVSNENWLTIGTITSTSVALSCSANTGDTDRTATVTMSYTGAESVEVTVTQGHYLAPGNWVLTNLSELTEEDIFVIVGTINNGGTYALPSTSVSSQGAPAAIAVNVVEGTLSGELDEELQFNLAGNATNGYTFYVNGDHEKWLYCSTKADSGSNNNIKVGASGNVNRNVFVLDEDNYLVTNDDNVDRYLSIYVSNDGAQDWRGYINTNSAATISFYKKVVEPVTETHTLTINGYTDVESKAGYYLIASPVTVDLTNHEMTTGDFDLYQYDDTQEKEWLNWKGDQELGYEGHFNLVPGKGYLYAKKATAETPAYTFTLTGTPYNEEGEFEIGSGWTLVGNPFGQEAEISMDYYYLTPDATELIATTASNNVAAMQGVFVYSENTSSVMFMPAENGTNNTNDSKLVLNVTRNRGNVVDRAIVRFGEGRQLPKLQLNPDNTKIYFAQADNDYAVVRSASEGEMPVSFRASENGTYTLSFSAENTEMRYMHLIDNMTGNDIDLLQTPSYSFEAKTTDYANRFRIVFNANNGVDEMDEDSFAFFNGSEWVINNEGEATLQVIDMMGRVVSSQTVNGNANVNINDAKGVYVIRLIQNDLVKTQKIVKE